MDMFLISQFLLAVIFFVLSAWHFYWLFGGEVGTKYVIPEIRPGEPAFKPSRIATFIVATGLLLLGVLALDRTSVFGHMIPLQIANYICRFFAAIFVLRAIGDFKLIGFFAKKNESGFSYWDKRLFSPLCVAIALLLITKLLIGE